MSETGSTASSSSKYRERTSRILEKAYESANSLAREHQGQNRGLAAGTAAAFISLGIDKLNKGDSSFEYTEAELAAIQDMAGSAAEEESKKSGNHFMDRLLDKMVKHTITEGEPDAELIEKRINDKDRKNSPSLSIRILISNFKKLSSKMTAFFALQYGLVHIITWKKPTKTLCFLFFYTSICLWPHLVLAYPLLFLMFGVLIPGYVYRHPMQTPELLKVKKRGQSIWDFLTDDSSSSILDDFISDGFMERMEENNNVLKPVSSRSSDSSTFVASNGQNSTSGSINTPEELQAHKEKKERGKKIQRQMNLLMNMRDLQNLTTEALKGMDKAEIFWYDTAGFKDEKLSTLIFYGVMVATSIIIFLGQFIPWRFIFIQSGWSIILLCHPNSKKYLVSLQKKKPPKLPPRPKEPITEKPQTPKIDKEQSLFERHDIIVDDVPEIRVVEIYELQYRSPTHSNYEPFNYTPKLFNVKDHLRMSGKTPTGVDHLSKVHPPKDWKFEMTYINTWTIDKSPKDFLTERSLLNPAIYHIKEDETEGWIYDNPKDIPDSDYVFRRRRLYRECYRYGREPARPDL
ncbi:peroxisomal membrane protein Pex28p [[Candida] jaroonii]|uniref:Peroxisomal membrane protein Pex28p n=1 Tax=[Candida] jaroonii TaxID=467808 RepID=A0ACA9Y100_9ASCO|nr:peroxisomal membrane protein Pex28p [[Candida] jaroonii]